MWPRWLFLVVAAAALGVVAACGKFAGDEVNSADAGEGADAADASFALNEAGDPPTPDASADGGADASSFSPAAITSLRMWLTPDSVTLDTGASVSTWKDISTNHNDLSGAAPCSPPAYVGDGGTQSYVSFNGGTQCLVRAGALGSNAGDARTFVVVGRYPVAPAASSGSGATWPMFFQSRSADSDMTPDNAIGLESDSASFAGEASATFGCYASRSGFVFPNLPLETASFAVHVLRAKAIVANAGLFSLLDYRYNGSNPGLVPRAKSGGDGSAKAAIAPTETGLATLVTSAKRYFGNVDVAEAMYFADALSAGDVLEVEKYLKAKYKIQ